MKGGDGGGSASVPNAHPSPESRRPPRLRSRGRFLVYPCIVGGGRQYRRGLSIREGRRSEGNPQSLVLCAKCHAPHSVFFLLLRVYISPVTPRLLLGRHTGTVLQSTRVRARASFHIFKKVCFALTSGSAPELVDSRRIVVDSCEAFYDGKAGNA